MPQSVVVSQSDSFVCIFPEYAQPKEVLNAINTSCSQIKELTGFSFTISVINHISDYLDLADAYTEERSMVDIARIIGKSGQIFFAGDLIKEQAYRHCVDNPYIRSYYQDTLEILRRYDAENDASLTETLEVYTSCLGIKTKAAETMGLHRNTLSFRPAADRGPSGPELRRPGDDSIPAHGLSYQPFFLRTIVKSNCPFCCA